MADPKRILTEKLRNAKRAAVLGVGSELRSDDAAGVLVARNLAGAIAVRGKRIRDFMAFDGATAPENMTGEIKKFNPDLLVIVDSADMGEDAGTVRVIDHDKVSGFSSCTHSLPLKILSDYLTQSIGCEIIIVGIQPGQLEFGGSVSLVVKKSVKHITGIIKKAIQL